MRNANRYSFEMSDTIPVVRKLQADAINSEISVSSLLRTAKLIATKLDLKDALVWIENELNGYGGVSSDELPLYRRLRGEPKGLNPYHGWQPIHFEDSEDFRLFSQAPVGQALGSIEKMLSKPNKGGYYTFPYPPEIRTHLAKSLDFPTNVELRIDSGSLWNILDQVRNLILDWSVELEKAGVVGEDMTFASGEKKDAELVTHQFFAQNISVIGNMSDSAQATIEQSAKSGLDLDQVTNFVAQVRNVLTTLPDDTRKQVESEVGNLEEELATTEPDESKIRSFLGSLKTIAEGAVGNLTAQGIITTVNSIIG